MSSMHTLRVNDNLQCGCLLCLFFSMGRAKPRKSNRQEVDTYAFLFYNSLSLNSGVIRHYKNKRFCFNLQIKEKKNRTY